MVGVESTVTRRITASAGSWRSGVAAGSVAAKATDSGRNVISKSPRRRTRADRERPLSARGLAGETGDQGEVVDDVFSRVVGDRRRPVEATVTDVHYFGAETRYEIAAPGVSTPVVVRAAGPPGIEPVTTSR